MDKFLERHKLMKLTQGEIYNLNRSRTSKEIKLVIFKFPTKKSQGPDACIGKIYQTFKELIPILHKHIQKIEEGAFPNSVLNASIILIPKVVKDIRRKL